jgi:hypothetical protein
LPESGTSSVVADAARDEPLPFAARALGVGELLPAAAEE